MFVGHQEVYKVEVYARVRRAVQVDGMSIREAARQFDLSRKTIRKMLQFSLPPGYERKKAIRRGPGARGGLLLIDVTHEASIHVYGVDRRKRVHIYLPYEVQQTSDLRPASGCLIELTTWSARRRDDVRLTLLDGDSNPHRRGFHLQSSQVVDHASKRCSVRLAIVQLGV